MPVLEFTNDKKSIWDKTAKKTVRKAGSKKLNDRSVVDMQEIYEGADNIIVERKWYQKQFICDFENIIKYPFDTELCNITVVYEGAAESLVELQPVM